MNTLNTQKTALAVGCFLGGWHLLWSLLVLIGWGQPIIDFVLWAHMVHLQYIVGPFELVAAATLIVFTFIVGYAMGWLFAALWNWLHGTRG
jgi:hypothetical protein